jgi:hypothetical protein
MNPAALSILSDVETVERGYTGLIILGVFLLAMFLLAIWWLKRQT